MRAADGCHGTAELLGPLSKPQRPMSRLSREPPENESAAEVQDRHPGGRPRVVPIYRCPIFYAAVYTLRSESVRSLMHPCLAQHLKTGGSMC